MRGRNSRRTATVALALVVALGLSACSDDDKKEATGAGATTTAAPTGQPSVSVSMAEYAFSVSGPLTAGGTIKLANKGKEFHMMGLAKLKPGKTLADVQSVLQQFQNREGGGESSTTEGQASTTGARTSTTKAQSSTTAAGSSTTAAGGAEGGGQEQDPFSQVAEQVGLPGSFMGPGQSADITVPDFGGGTYAMMCFLATEDDPTPHFAKGMISQLTVVPGTAPAPPTADATYKIVPGKAMEGPATLTAGRHTLKFEAAPGSEQLEPKLAKLNPGASIEQFVNAADQTFGEGEESPPLPKDAASKLPGQVVWAGFDLMQTTTFYVTTDFATGTYGMDSSDTDVHPRPKPDKEVIEITVR